MTAGEEALDIAFGLLRVPARRESLRTRPLPDGVAEVIAIASGDDAALQAAVVRTGHAPGELLEATRFYIQQILLAEDADAYRVLGTRPGAEHAQLRRHHRLLLRWLHPDRGQDWGAAFAWRINDAWRALRTPAARAAYDRRHPALPRAVADRSPIPPAPDPPRPVVPPSMPDRRNVAAPWIVGTLAAACGLLAWLAIRSDWAPPHEGDVPLAVQARGTDRPASARPTAPAPVPTTTSPVPAAAPGSREWGPSGPAPAPADPTLPTLAPLVSTDAMADVSPAPAPVQATDLAPAPAASRVAPVARPPAAVADPLPAARPRPTVATAPPPDAAGGDPDDPVLRLREAERLVSALVEDLTARAPTDAAEAAPDTVAAARDALHARVAPGLRRRMALQAPDWTIGERSASMQASYRLNGWRGTGETGWLRVTLVRDGTGWQLDDLRLEPAVQEAVPP